MKSSPFGGAFFCWNIFEKSIVFFKKRSILASINFRKPAMTYPTTPQRPYLISLQELIGRKGKSNKRTVDKIRRQGFSAVMPVVKMVVGEYHLLTGHAVVESYAEAGVGHFWVFLATDPAISAIEENNRKKAERNKKFGLTCKRAWEIAREKAGGSKGSRVFYKEAYQIAKTEMANA